MFADYRGSSTSWLRFVKKVLLALALSASWLAAQAAVVVVFGSNSNSQITSFLNANGHVATNLANSAPTAGQLAGVDAVVMMRTTGNASLQSWVLGGGLLITEWDSSIWALNTAGLLASTDIGGGFVGTNSTSMHTAEGLALGLGTGLSNPYVDSNRTEFARSFSPLGVETDVLAERSAGQDVIIGGNSGAGYTLINGWDWGDSFPAGGSVSGQWLLNALNVAPNASVPEPGSLALVGAALLALRLKKPRR